MGKNERSGMVGETEGGKEVKREGDRRRGIRKKEWGETLNHPEREF